MSISFVEDIDVIRDSRRFSLRRNDILNWVEKLEKVSQYLDILKSVPMTSTLEIESGIVKIAPNNRYIGHEFVPLVKEGFSFVELSTILRSEVVKFNFDYGQISLDDKDLYALKQVVYQYNRLVTSAAIYDNKEFSRLHQSSEVLYYLLSKSIILTAQVNGCCSLYFTKGGNSVKEYCTIFSEEQIKLLERVNSVIQQR